MNTTVTPLIDAEILARRLEDPLLRLFDCRFDLARPDAGAVEYLDGHIPGARYLHLDRDLSAPITATSGRHPLPTPAEFAARLRRWGVNADSAVVAHDAGNGMYAARLWWMLRWLGHARVQVLDGGFARWRSLGLPVTDALPHLPPGDFLARPQPESALEADAVLALLGDRTSRILDARAPERFRGEVEPLDTVAGHIPSAVNLPYALSLASDGRMRPPEELRAAFAATLQDVPPSRVVAMCGSGVTACHLLLALEHAGLGGARLYPGSWSEWIRDPRRPVA